MSNRASKETDLDAEREETRLREGGGARARMAQVMKPTGKVYRGGGTDVGDGDRCHVDGHGKMYVYGARQWCPHQSHDMGVPRDATEAQNG